MNNINQLPEGHPRRMLEERREAQRNDPSYYIPNAIQRVDLETDALYQRIIGNRGPEYIRAEAEASAYSNAGFTGTVPPTVQSWATVKGWTGQQAAEDILAQAAAWNGLQAAVRFQRLSTKEAVRTASDFDSVQVIMATWDNFLRSIP